MGKLEVWWFTAVHCWHVRSQGDYRFADGEFTLIRHLNWGRINDIYKLMRGAQFIAQLDLPSPSHFSGPVKHWANQTIRRYLLQPEQFDFSRHPENSPRALREERENPARR